MSVETAGLGLLVKPASGLAKKVIKFLFSGYEHPLEDIYKKETKFHQAMEPLEKLALSQQSSDLLNIAILSIFSRRLVFHFFLCKCCIRVKQFGPLIMSILIVILLMFLIMRLQPEILSGGVKLNPPTNPSPLKLEDEPFLCLVAGLTTLVFLCKSSFIVLSIVIIKAYSYEIESIRKLYSPHSANAKQELVTL